MNDKPRFVQSLFPWGVPDTHKTLEIPIVSKKMTFLQGLLCGVAAGVTVIGGWLSYVDAKKDRGGREL